MSVSMSIPRKRILVVGPSVFSGARVTPNCAHSSSRTDNASEQALDSGGPMRMKSSR